MELKRQGAIKKAKPVVTPITKSNTKKAKIGSSAFFQNGLLKITANGEGMDVGHTYVSPKGRGRVGVFGCRKVLKSFGAKALDTH